MPYATLDDLGARYGADELARLSDRTGTGAADDAVLSQALADATAEMDGYLTARGLTGSTHPVLVRLACQIARYFLYDDAPPEEVRKRYDDAVALLRRVASGEIQLGVSSDAEPGAAPAPAAAPAVFLAGPAPVFGRRRGIL